MDVSRGNHEATIGLPGGPLKMTFEFQARTASGIPHAQQHRTFRAQHIGREISVGNGDRAVHGIHAK